MAQLVQLQKSADKFEKLNTEVIFIFREEREGIAGLKKIQTRTKTTFTLAVDLNKKGSAAYSPNQRTFDNYVIDHQGVVRKIIPGTLRVRATTDELIKALTKIEEGRKKPPAE